MIHILDEILLDPERIPAVLALLHERYLPGNETRGVTLTHSWVSPPVALPDRPNTLWLLWQVSGWPDYYRMRSLIGPEVFGFWAAVDEICHRRSRHVMTDAAQPLPQPVEPGHAE